MPSKQNKFFEHKGRKIPLLLVIVSIYAVHLFFNSILVPLRVASSSMKPNINQNSRLFYSSVGMPNSVLAFSRKIPRGTLVVLAAPYHKPLGPGWQWLNILYRFITLNIADLNHLKKLGNNPYMVRRVIGIPGDTVYMTNYIAQIQPSGEEYFTSEFELIQKDYVILSADEKTRNWARNLPLLGNIEKFKLRQDEYFVLADNRKIGNDSSYWGPVQIAQIRGRVLFQYIKKNE